MATSAEYEELYEQYKSAYNIYKDNLKDLNAILKAMTKNLDDDISKVNKKIDNLIDDLDKSVRHNASFKKNKKYLTDQSSVYVDSNMSAAIREIQEEIASVSKKKNDAESYRDYYKKLYDQAVEEENAAWWAAYYAQSEKGDTKK